MADQIAEFCGNCGTPNTGKNNFCEKCGATLSVASPTVQYPISQQAPTPTERDTKIAAVKAQITTLKEEIAKLEKHYPSWILAIIGFVLLFVFLFGIPVLIIMAIVYWSENKEIEKKKDILFRMESELNRLEGY